MIVVLEVDCVPCACLDGRALPLVCDLAELAERPLSRLDIVLMAPVQLGELKVLSDDKKETGVRDDGRR